MSGFGTGNLWGIDLGGTKVEGLILKSGTDSDVLFRDRVPTEAEMGYRHILDQVEKLVNMMIAAAGYKPGRIGFATPGTLDPKLGVMKNCNTVAMNGKPMKADLEQQLGLQVEMANDADCFALAEAELGVVKQQFPGANIVFGVILGTGVGGGIVVNSKAIVGLQGIAGEWGHNYLDESGGPCYCGKSGCVEKVISGPALEQYYFKESGSKRSLKEIVSLSESGADAAATKTMARLTDFFGKALSVVINILDPDVVVIGGGVGNVDVIYKAGLDSLRRNVFNNRLDTPVVRPLLGDSAGVYGAAFLVN
jgi:predicted NBD/HSP70 family sugar kinase